MSWRKLNSVYQNVENQGRRCRSRLTPIACIVCEMVFFDNISLVLHFQCHQQSENQGRHSRSPIACIMCNMVFFDNVSLVLHSESHLPAEISIPSGDLPTLSPCPSPSVERTNEARSPRENKCFIRPSPVPVSFTTPDLAPRDANRMLNSMQPIISSSDATSLYGSTSSSTHPLSGSRTFAFGPTTAQQNEGQACPPNPGIPCDNQPEEPEVVDLNDTYEEVEEEEEEKAKTVARR